VRTLATVALVMRSRELVSIVDDDESVRQALEGLFRSVGLQVAVFASAEHFLRSSYLATTRCLILDLQMTGMDGLALQRRLTEDGRRIPIIIITAHGDDETRVHALRAGAAAFLSKPFDAETVLRLVEVILRGAK
jgi:FixJ family two-component response regulator